jgi:protoporphyrinogen/coproporphyrinogen III oxidase
MNAVTTNQQAPTCVVVGAGVAGLTAAWWLKQAGVLSLVVEAEGHVGGRTRSISIHGCRINTGAAFFTSFYDETLSLCSHLRVPLVEPLIHPTRAGNNRHMVTPLGRIPYAPSKPVALLRFPAVDIGQKARLVKTVTKILCGPALHIAEPESLVPYDDDNAVRWGRREIGEEATDYFVRPAIEPFFYAHASQVSAGVARALLRHAVRWRLSTPRDGMDALARTLAATLDVRVGCRACQLQSARRRILVHNKDGSVLAAKYVIIAIPPRDALELAPPITSDDQEDLESWQRYESSVALFLGYRRIVDLPSVSTTVGGPGRHRLVGLTALSRGGVPGFIPLGQEVISVLAMGEHSRRLLRLSPSAAEEVLRADVSADLGLDLPRPDWSHIVRREAATLVAGPGSLERVVAFSRRQRARVHFAGDWLSGVSTVEGAVRSGRKAALAVLKDIATDRD